MSGGREIIFKHGGDLGDIIAALPILRALGGGKVLLFHDCNAAPHLRPRESLEGARYEAIKPLLEVQSYVTSVEFGYEVATKGFRDILRPKHESLAERQARHFGKWPIDLSPWLTVPSFEKHDRIICARSSRYHSRYFFPWKEAHYTYGNRLLFVGLPEEHTAFEATIGRKVEHAKTDNFLQIAQLMAGSPQVLANQSSPLWVAIGLGCKVICEGHPEFPNSEIRRPGSFWAYSENDMEIVRRAFATVRDRRS